MAELKEKMERLLSEESFLRKLEELENEEQLLTLLSENGLNGEEAKEAATVLKEYFEKVTDEEINEDDLENVAGGLIIARRWPPIIPTLPIPTFPWIPKPKKWPTW